MRALDYAAVRQEARDRAAAVRLAVGLQTRRDQTHDDEQWLTLLRLDQQRLERWLATGKLRVLAPRRFALS